MLTIKLTLPKRSAPTEKIGGNSIYKLLFRQTKIKATVKKSEFPGYFELETGLTPPLDVIFLKDPNSRGKCPNDLTSLKAKKTFTLASWDEENELLWENFPDTYSSTDPNEINL